MIDTDRYEEFENAMNEGRIERVHCLWALAEIKRLRGIAKTCLEAEEAGGDRETGTMMLIKENLKRMIEDVDISD